MIKSIFIGAALFGLGAVVSQAQMPPSIIVADAHTGKIFIEKNATHKRPVASLTKVATAAVVLDWAHATQTDLGTLAQVPMLNPQFFGANPMGLQPVDQISLRDALYSALLGSDNVAALTLANHVGNQLLIARRKSGDPLKAFVNEMNALAKSLGMRDTKFVNPHGLDNSRKRGLSTAMDMATLMAREFRDSRFVFFAKQRSREVSFFRGGSRLQFVVKNTNELLGRQNILVGKTGQTAAAGSCLAVGAEKSGVKVPLPDGRKGVVKRFLISVVLGSPNRFPHTENLVAQGWGEFDKWQAMGFPVNQPGARFLPR